MDSSSRRSEIADWFSADSGYGEEQSHYHTGRKQLLSKQQAIDVLRKLYSEKLRADVNSEKQGRHAPRLDRFVKSFFFCRHGLPKEANEHMLRFLAAVLKYAKESRELDSFGKSVGILDVDSESNYNQMSALHHVFHPRKDEMPMVKYTNLLGVETEHLHHAFALGLVDVYSQQKLPKLAPETFVHPALRNLTEELWTLGGMEFLYREIESGNFWRVIDNLDLGTPVFEDTLPQLHWLISEAADVLQQPCPEAYVKRSSEANAFICMRPVGRVFHLIHSFIHSSVERMIIMRLLFNRVGAGQPYSCRQVCWNC